MAMWDTTGLTSRVNEVLFLIASTCAILKHHNIGYHIYADDTKSIFHLNVSILWNL